MVNFLKLRFIHHTKDFIDVWFVRIGQYLAKIGLGDISHVIVMRISSTAPGVYSRCVCVHCCVCVHFGWVNAEHKFQVWVTILAHMSRHLSVKPVL